MFARARIYMYTYIYVCINLEHARGVRAPEISGRGGADLLQTPGREEEKQLPPVCVQKSWRRGRTQDLKPDHGASSSCCWL